MSAVISLPNDCHVGIVVKTLQGKFVNERSSIFNEEKYKVYDDSPTMLLLNLLNLLNLLVKEYNRTNTSIDKHTNTAKCFAEKSTYHDAFSSISQRSHLQQLQ